MIAQNHPGVLDGLLPVQSYPDMVTQTIHVGDCELLEHYMDATDRTNAKWRTTKNRSWLVGMNAEEDAVGTNAKVNDALAPLKSRARLQHGERLDGVHAGWRGLTPLAMNPLYGQAPNSQFYEPQSDIAAIRWTHYDDLRNVYGVDASGAARADLGQRRRAVRPAFAASEGKITPAEFVHLNWQHRRLEAPERHGAGGLPVLRHHASEIQKALTIPGYFDPWSRRNMNLAAPAPTSPRRARGRPDRDAGRLHLGPCLRRPARRAGDRPSAVHGARTGHAQLAPVASPCASVCSSSMGHSDNLVVWFTDTTPGTPKASQSLEALAVMDEWMTQHPPRTRARASSATSPPRRWTAASTCRASRSTPATDAWSGILDSGAPGACTQTFPLYGTSRTVAGAPIEGGIYSCARKPVEQAVADGTYAPWAPERRRRGAAEADLPAGRVRLRRAGPGEALTRGTDGRSDRTDRIAQLVRDSAGDAARRPMRASQRAARWAADVTSGADSDPAGRRGSTSIDW